MVKVEMRLRMMDLYQNKRAASTLGYNESNCHRIKEIMCQKYPLRGLYDICTYFLSP